MRIFGLVTWWDGGGVTQVTENIFENIFVRIIQITSACSINRRIVRFPISRDVASGDFVFGRFRITFYALPALESYRTPLFISCFNDFVVRRQVVEIDGCFTIKKQTPGLNV
jgi:hypothetical protein